MVEPATTMSATDAEAWNKWAQANAEMVARAALEDYSGMFAEVLEEIGDALASRVRALEERLDALETRSAKKRRR